MNPHYLENVKYAFRELDVYYWQIGDVVLIRLLPFLDGRRTLDQFDAIVKSEKVAARIVVRDYLSRIEAGEGAGTGPNPIPEQFFQFLDPATGKLTISDDGCTMMRLVITGRLDEGNSKIGSDDRNTVSKPDS